MVWISVSLNNSGGVDWLNEWHIEQLIANGWVRDEEAFDAYMKQFNTVDEAKDDFGSITGMDPDAEGCPCCGRPFYFMEE